MEQRLAQQCAHWLFHTSGIDTVGDEYIPALPDQAQRIEILCNRYAAEFFVPESAFRAAFAGHDASEETAELLAVRFHISRKFIYCSFLDRELIDEPTYGQINFMALVSRNPHIIQIHSHRCRSSVCGNAELDPIIANGLFQANAVFFKYGWTGHVYGAGRQNLLAVHVDFG